MLHQVLKKFGKKIEAAILNRSIRKNGCRLLQTSGPGGYVQVTIRLDDSVYFMNTAHRAIWMVHNGPIPKGVVIMHKCDHQNCAEYNHLAAGTPADNMADKVAKNRQTKGEDFKHSKLTESAVRQIRKLYASGTSMPALAATYGVTLQAIAAVVHRKTWKHVT